MGLALLERWGRLRGREDAIAAARRLYEAGRRGIDPARGVAMNELWDDFADPGRPGALLAADRAPQGRAAVRRRGRAGEGGAVP